MKIPSQAADAISNGQTVVGQALSGVADEFHDFVSDMEVLIKETTVLTGDDLVRAKAKLNARVKAARESVAEIGGALADQARDTARATDGFVHQHPWQSIGIGAALGVLVGFILARRN